MSLPVSILIPCHNAAPWVGACVQSALAQTWPKTEVIVMDDGSGDGSPEQLQAFAGRARVLCREQRGANPTRNELLQLATGDWIQFLDADDLLLPEKVARQMAVVADHPEADVVYSPLLIEEVGQGNASRETWDPHDRSGHHDPWAYHLAWSLTQTSGALFRRSTLLAAGGWNEEQRICQDNELFFRLLKHGAEFVRCGFTGTVYRRFSGQSLSTRDPKRLRAGILQLLEEGEGWLKARNGLSSRRLQALNQMRFTLARGAWENDRGAALRIMEQVRRSHPGFFPSPGREAPPLYRAGYRLFGFSGAQRIAAGMRSLRR